MSAINSMLMVAAEAREFRGILRNCARVVRLDWPVDFASAIEFRGRRLVCVANGPGFGLVSKALEIAGRMERFESVVSTGFCGGLDPTLAIGDVVEAKQVLDVASGECYSCQSFTQGPHALLASVDRVAETAAEKAELRQATGARAVEMEAAVVARFAAGISALFYCVRVVSDTAGHSFTIPLNRLRDADGRFNKTGIIWEALKRPITRVPGLLQLDRNCALAENRLGEFFANCNFA
jgi:adenosylhomocysteine nucleosidase